MTEQGHNFGQPVGPTRLKKEVGRFLVAGFSAVGTDLAVYWLLLHVLSHSPAKAASFISGTAVAYVINKYWTFEKGQHSYAEMGRFLALYLSTLFVNVGVNKIALLILPVSVNVSLAFLVATGCSTVLNFIGQKWWVFR